MITITIYTDQTGAYTGFDTIGHAEYAQAGEDIVCAGASALVMNAINSIEAFTEDRFELNTREETGFISFRFPTAASHDAGLLMNSLVFGLQGIQDFYGNEYISLIFKEV
ncbi:MAG: ribosomal-processing cysteine protease Prp [Lachnospiraceae bacterium]|nr:ribosomal-processing cysteine protease Prp [Lachnospiraceae bacterium]